MKIKYIIIHHTATLRDSTTFNAVKNYHINQLGWKYIGYNWLITFNGVLHEGRPQNVVGAHTKDDGMNYKSLGISLAGNFENERPTKAQIKTLKGIIKQVRDIYKIPLENVLGHNEVKGTSTLCPGKNLLSIIKEIRNEVLPEKDNELMNIIKDLRKENNKLKTKNNTLNKKLTKSNELINILKVEIKSRQTWFNKLINIIKKNE